MMAWAHVTSSATMLPFLVRVISPQVQSVSSRHCMAEA